VAVVAPSKGLCDLVHERRRHRIPAWSLLAGAAALLVAFAAVWWTDGALIAPANHPIGPPPGDLHAEPVEFRTDDNDLLRGWFAQGDLPKGGVVLLHGVRSDRRSMVDRARFLTSSGYSVVLFDLQAHGESPGERITFGYRESGGARAAIRYLRRRVPGQRVGAIGASLGGAACLLGRQPLDVDALVLEAVYPDVRQAAMNRLRLRFGPMGEWLAPVLTIPLETRLGIRAGDLRPIDGIRRVRSPVLVIGGAQDRRTTASETRALFDAAPDPKELWLIEGAAHVDFYRYAAEEYRRRILEFLRRHLDGRQGSTLNEMQRAVLPKRSPRRRQGAARRGGRGSYDPRVARTVSRR